MACFCTDHVIKGQSVLQSAVSLFSCEPEYHALVQGGAGGLGPQYFVLGCKEHDIPLRSSRRRLHGGLYKKVSGRGGATSLRGRQLQQRTRSASCRREWSIKAVVPKQIDDARSEVHAVARAKTSWKDVITNVDETKLLQEARDLHAKGALFADSVAGSEAGAAEPPLDQTAQQKARRTDWQNDADERCCSAARRELQQCDVMRNDVLDVSH